MKDALYFEGKMYRTFLTLDGGSFGLRDRLIEIPKYRKIANQHGVCKFVRI